MFIVDVLILIMVIMAITFNIKQYIETEQKRFLFLAILVAVGAILFVISMITATTNLIENFSKTIENLVDKIK